MMLLAMILTTAVGWTQPAPVYSVGLSLAVQPQPADEPKTPPAEPKPATEPTPAEPSCPLTSPKVPSAAPTPPPAASETPPEIKPGAPITTPEALLSALEVADADMRTIQADCRYDKIFEIAGDEQVRWGKLYYEDQTKPGEARMRRFAASFEQLRIGRRIEKEPVVYVFDGTMLIETRPTRKEMVRSRVAREGEAIDPLRIGEGPLPLPIGQKRDDILARFEATLLPADADLPDIREKSAFSALVAGAYQLRLSPKPGIKELREFADIRLWYRESGGRLLPVAAKTTNKTGDLSIFWLDKVQVNASIEPHVWASETPGEGWSVVERNLADPEGR